LLDSGKFFSLTWVGSLLFGDYQVSSILTLYKMSSVKEDRGVCHIIPIDRFYVGLKHYNPFAKRFLLVPSDPPLDIG